MKSIQKGYPFDGIKSREVLPSRVGIELNNDKVGIIIDSEKFPNAPLRGDGISTEEFETKLKEFAFDRIYELNTALNIAEQQIEDIFAEYPFIPEDFGFIEDALPTSETDLHPTKFYSKNGLIIVRADDNKWIISSDKISRQTIEINNSHEAYIFFKAIGAIKDEEFTGETHSFTEGQLTDQPAHAPEQEA